MMKAKSLPLLRVSKNENTPRRATCPLDDIACSLRVLQERCVGQFSLAIVKQSSLMHLRQPPVHAPRYLEYNTKSGELVWLRQTTVQNHTTSHNVAMVKTYAVARLGDIGRFDAINDIASEF